MPHAFADIAFTASVKAAQARDGSRSGYARHFEGGDEIANQQLGDDEVQFIARQRSFYMATVSQTNWPYVQHRGGPRGFLKVLDSRTLSFADFIGNRQLVSVGNVAMNDRVALIIVDYAHRMRLKILGHLQVIDFDSHDTVATSLLTPGYSGKPQRVMTIKVEGFDWNCPQHIPVLLELEEVRSEISARDDLIEDLKRRLAEATQRLDSTKDPI